MFWVYSDATCTPVFSCITCIGSTMVASIQFFLAVCVLGLQWWLLYTSLFLHYVYGSTVMPPAYQSALSGLCGQYHTSCLDFLWTFPDTKLRLRQPGTINPFLIVFNSSLMTNQTHEHPVTRSVGWLLRYPGVTRSVGWLLRCPEVTRSVGWLVLMLSCCCF